MPRLTLRTLFIGCAALGCSAGGRTETGTGGITRTVSVANCSQGQAGLTLPDGFCATIFADKLGAVRHMVVAPNGDLFVNMQRARRTSPLAAIAPSQVALRDTNGDGIADETRRFGEAGGTGIALFDGFLYADVGTAIVRYRVTPGQLQTWGAPDTVVTGLPGDPGHTARNFVIGPSGTMFVNIGSATNACQEKDRTAGSRGAEGCPELRTRAGLWRFAANGSKQTPSLENRYATGMRNTVAMAIEPGTGRLFATPHGRDQLAGNWPALFTDAQNAEIPAEELLDVSAGDDFGWPFCYYDSKTATRLLAPEYGGDGKTVGRCAAFKRPLYGFPAHWAPNAMMFYEGTHFPARYRQGVFVAFHGSWNRAPLPQQGFKVVFMPFNNGRPAANFETFADGFAGPTIPATGAPHRPTGLAQGPDGALFISDDAGGRIWRVTYRGSR
ncbi:MAG TPA: PQQ-dependent sugar dehydrogenase [Gemmatimonadaceae bacterium]|nr:PQQ-dependent sugar dehydrogenase [Gemmatimonadaceae bacterium]